MLKRHLNAATFETLLRSELLPTQSDTEQSKGLAAAVRRLFKGKKHEAESNEQNIQQQSFLDDIFAAGIACALGVYFESEYHHHQQAAHRRSGSIFR